MPRLQSQAERGREMITLPEWHPDCGGDWVLSGPGFFANYWPDNTVVASIVDEYGNALESSGIVSGTSLGNCQSFAESWIREHMHLIDASAKAKLDAIRALVDESLARMEPVSWIGALTEILDGNSDGKA
jgi:hypothetical protein